MVKLIVSSFNVESTSTNKTWKVAKYDDGSWACSCPAWIFKKGERKDCKHIEEVKKTNMEHYKTISITGITPEKVIESLSEVAK